MRLVRFDYAAAAAAAAAAVDLAQDGAVVFRSFPVAAAAALP